MKKRLMLITLATALVALLSTFLAGCGHEPHGDGKATAKFYCPMHPTYTSDRPGDCPICNMKLVPIKDAAATRDEDGADSGPTSVAGRIPVMISSEKRQMIGVTTSPVEERSLSRIIRVPGTVVHDETRLARIAPRFGGWVRKLFVNYTGQPVEKGQPLFTVYSPELFTTENDYLLALRNYQSLSNSLAAQRDSARHLVESARRRLELLQVGAEEIRELEQRGRPSDELLIRAPVTGHVILKAAVEGQGFQAGETLFQIADLSHLWVEAYVFEFDLPEIQVGQKARVIFPYLNRTFESEVTFIYPHIDPQTRRAELRLELGNPQHLLRPDMWANVELVVDHGNVLTVPASAVINTGTRFIAFVDRPDQHLEPREVKIGTRTDHYYEVLDGLEAGERVVTRALFLVDSESQLKAAISGMSGAGAHEH